MTTPRLAIKRLEHAPDAPLPAYQTVGAAGLDLTAQSFVTGAKTPAASVVLEPGARILVTTGLAVAIPEGHVGLVCPRSGLALKSGVTVLNAPGIIDADYRGELGVILVNLSATAFTLERGMRVAQLVIVQAAQAEIAMVTELPETTRGAGGFGSTGK